jgi:transposase-like protein
VSRKVKSEQIDTARKLAILAEVEGRAEGVSVPSIAAKHGVSTSLIYYWIDRKRRGVLDERSPPKKQGRKKREVQPVEIQIAAVRAAMARGPGETLASVATTHGVEPGLLGKWIQRHGPQLAAHANGRAPKRGTQLALPVHEIAPTYVNSSGPLPDVVQVALLRRNNGVLKSLIHQLLEHL